jgi:hypothetical protein
MMGGTIPFCTNAGTAVNSVERVMSRIQPQRKSHVDFDEMLALAKSDPASFESRREEYIESFLTSIPAEKRRRLRGLQWRIDQTRQLARSHMASCIAISNMMWDSLQLLGLQQRELVKLTTGQTTQFIHLQSASASATIIPFPTNRT